MERTTFTMIIIREKRYGAIAQTLSQTGRNISRVIRGPKKVITSSGHAISIEKNAPFWRSGESAKDIVKNAYKDVKGELNRTAAFPGSTMQRTVGDMVEKPISTAVGVANPLDVPIPTSNSLSLGIENPEIVLQKNLGIRKNMKHAADSLRMGKAANPNNRLHKVLAKTGNTIKDATNAGVNYFNMLSGGPIMPLG